MSENPIISQIVNSEAVIQHLGYWPDFHDAEVKKVTFASQPGYRASVIFLLEAFEITSEIGERGQYKLAKRCDIEFQFTGILELEFNGFNHQNVLFELVFEEQSGNIKCSFSSSVGMDATVVAEEVLVLSLQPTVSRNRAKQDLINS